LGCTPLCECNFLSRKTRPEKTSLVGGISGFGQSDAPNPDRSLVSEFWGGGGGQSLSPPFSRRKFPRTNQKKMYTVRNLLEWKICAPPMLIMSLLVELAEVTHTVACEIFIELYTGRERYRGVEALQSVHADVNKTTT